VRSTVAAGQAADTEFRRRKYRAAASQEARIFSAMLICIADAAHHTIVQRGCISFNRTDMVVVIWVRAPVEARQLKRQ